MKSPLKVLIVDDHLMFREGIRERLMHEERFEVVGEAQNADEAIALLEQAPVDIAILDIRMPGKSGIELARQIRQDLPDVKLLILSGYDFDQYIRAFSRIGIHGYLLKDSPQETLIKALHEIADGGVVLPPRIASKVMRSFATEASGRDSRQLWELTVRELEILEHLHEGLRNVEIAQRLRISARTVETHVSNIISKLDVRSRTEAVRMAVDRGLIR